MHPIIDSEALLEDVVPALLAVGLLVRILPVSHQELKLLEGDLTRVLEGKSAVLGEVMKVLEVVLLDVIEQVVHQHGARHQGQGEDGGTVPHGAAERISIRRKMQLTVHGRIVLCKCTPIYEGYLPVLVEGPLSVHQRHSHLLARVSLDEEDLGPHEDASGVPLHPTPTYGTKFYGSQDHSALPPMESTQVFIILSKPFLRSQTFQISQHEIQEKRFALSEGT